MHSDFSLKIPEIILLTLLCDYVGEFCLYSQCSHLNLLIAQEVKMCSSFEFTTNGPT